jgi:Porin subfamily
MRPMKRVLLGSAAGIFTVSGVQAADLPTKAQPVEYLKACSLYGAGFWYVPGTDTCIKIGAFVRLQLGYGAGGSGVPAGVGGSAPGEGDFGGGNARGTNMFNFGSTGAISFDMRQQTEYGTLRSYVDMGVQTNSNTGGYGGPNVLNPLFPSASYGGQAAYADRAFIQFAGFTAGRIRSFFDLVNPGAYSLTTTRLVSADTGGIGIIGGAYTWQFGGGLSASVSLEDGGWSTGGRGRSTVNLASGSLPIGATDMTSAFGAGEMATDVKGQQFFDPVFNLRLDQAWGFIGASFALHDASGGYYGTGYNCGSPSPVGLGGANTGLCAGGGNTPNNSTPPYNAAGLAPTTCGAVSGSECGHPADKFGWASTVGATWVNAFGLAGDILGVQGAYCYGAVGYCTQAWGSKFIYGSGNNVGYSYLVDGIFNTNTPVFLTQTWSAVSYYEHVWTPQWRTSVYGGLLGTNWGSQAIAQVCTYPAGFGPVGFSAGSNSMFSNTNSPGFPTTQTNPPSIVNNFKGSVSNCNPNSSWVQVGTRTMWNPVPDIDIGFDLSYIRLNTAFAGTAVLGALGTVFQSNAIGRPSGLYSIDNQNVYSAMFRVQRNFLY